MSVFDFLKENKFQPFPERHIQDFAKSLLKSLSCECREGERMAGWGGPAS
jgi:dual-specificity kinase